MNTEDCTKHTLYSSVINTMICTTTTQEGGTEASCGSPIDHDTPSFLFKGNHYPDF